jgi:hypothetical protein
MQQEQSCQPITEHSQAERYTSKFVQNMRVRLFSVAQYRYVRNFSSIKQVRQAYTTGTRQLIAEYYQVKSYTYKFVHSTRLVFVLHNKGRFLNLPVQNRLGRYI